MGKIIQKLFAVLSLSFLLPGLGHAQEADLRNPEALRRLLENEERKGDFLLIDVRTPGEYASGHIPGAININHTDIAARIEEAFAQNGVENTKDAEIVVYCRSGSRSGYARGVLESMGYTNVTNFGGIFRWDGDLAHGSGK